MAQQRQVDSVFRSYFDLYSQATGKASVVIGPMPGMGAQNNLRDHLMAKLMDERLYLRELTSEEMDAAALRYAGAAGTKTYRRYVRASLLAELPPHEQRTGQVHPDDPECHEVEGVLAREPNYREIGVVLGISGHEVSNRLARARRKVSAEVDRIGWRQERDEQP